MENIRIIETDIFTLDCDVIGHQVNCQGVMGAGLAKEIKIMFPKVFTEYRKMCSIENKSDNLGKCLIVERNNAKTFEPKYIANIFAQDRYGKDKCYTSYDSFKKALIDLKIWCKNNIDKDKIIIGLPYKIGCGLAGGDWNIVEPIIENVFGNDNKFEIILCKQIIANTAKTFEQLKNILNTF